MWAACPRSTATGGCPGSEAALRGITAICSNPPCQRQGDCFLLWGSYERAGRLVSGGVHLLDVQVHSGLWNFQESKSGPERPRKIESVLKSVLQAKRNPAETQCFCGIFVCFLSKTDAPSQKRGEKSRISAGFPQFQLLIFTTFQKRCGKRSGRFETRYYKN